VDITGSSTLDEIKAWLQLHVDKGVHCPCCGQHAKIYKRPVSGNMALVLIALYRQGRDWIHLEDTPRPDDATKEAISKREWAKMAYWGLIEQKEVTSTKTKNSGVWRITEAGIDFVLGRSSIQKYAIIYAAQLLGFKGKQVTIDDALGEKFDYVELMTR